MTIEIAILLLFPFWVMLLASMILFKSQRKWVSKEKHENSKRPLSEKVKRCTKLEVTPKEKDALLFLLGMGYFYAVYDKKLERIIIKFKDLMENTVYNIEVLSEKNFDKMYKEVG